MNETLENIWDVLRDLVPFAQFKKQPWKSVTFSQVVVLTLTLLPHWYKISSSYLVSVPNY